jgi:hypothetical protein
MVSAVADIQRGGCRPTAAAAAAGRSSMIPGFQGRLTLQFENFLTNLDAGTRRRRRRTLPFFLW